MPEAPCFEIAQLKRHEYENVRARGNTFLVAPGHEVFAVEGVTIARLAQRFDAYSLMEKIGDAAERATELDPRAARRWMTVRRGWRRTRRCSAK